MAVTGCGLPRWPISGPMTSPFGIRTLGLRPDLHHGVDIGVPVGTAVGAMTTGTVLHAGPRAGYGLAVVLDHGWGWTTFYGHLSALRVDVGDRVAAGSLIGLSGNSGVSTGPHLHFEIRRFDRPLDPVPLLGGFP